MKDFFRLIFCAGILFLCIHIFGVPYWAFEFWGKIKGIISSSKEKVELFQDSKFPGSWEVAEATYYDPMDPKQTKENPDGYGASGRKVECGSVAMDSIFFCHYHKQKKIVYIEIKNSSLMTPYGKGIFRVDDRLNERYKDKRYLEFHQNDLSEKYKRIGRFNIHYRIVRVEKIKKKR